MRLSLLSRWPSTSPCDGPIPSRHSITGQSRHATGGASVLLERAQLGAVVVVAELARRALVQGVLVRRDVDAVCIRAEVAEVTDARTVLVLRRPLCPVVLNGQDVHVPRAQWV